MKKVGFFYDDVFLLHEMPPGHPESKDRLVSLLKYLEAGEIWRELAHFKPSPAGRDDILLVHTASFYEKVLHFTGYFDADTYVSPRTADAAHYAAGAVISAVGKCRAGEIDRAFCAVRPPGHHAEANRAMGFCIFNNVAIGARLAGKLGYERIFIVDFDVHHGNGTQHIFEEEEDVFYFSTHQFPHYPGTGDESERGRGKGRGFTFNVPMHYGAGDKEYAQAYGDLLPRLVHDFKPDLMLVSAGYDLHVKDPLAGIRVTSEGIRRIVKSIVLSMPEIPQIFCLEGGYNPVSLSESVGITLEELLYRY